MASKELPAAAGTTLTTAAGDPSGSVAGAQAPAQEPELLGSQGWAHASANGGAADQRQVPSKHA